MAGIGLELKKIYSENHLSNMAVGAAYSSMVTVGPTLLIVALLVVMYIVMGFNFVEIASRELLTSTILYIFIFCTVLISPFNTVFSRYIADKIYNRQGEDILPSYYTGLALVSFLASLLALPIAYRLITIGKVDVFFVLAAYVFWISTIVVFFSTIYLHATKDYKTIFLFYVIGMFLAFVTAYLFRMTNDAVHSIIYGLAIGFFIIATLEFSHVKHAFRKSGKNYTECLRYIWRFKGLFLANLFYSLGIYVHVFIFWFWEGRIVIANTFLSHPIYDMATCIAMFSNISTTIIFIVMAETEFHDLYQQYMQAVIGGTYRLLDKNKSVMFRTLYQQLLRLFTIQSVITALMLIIVVTFLPRLFFNTMVIAIYPILSIGYFILFMLYSLIIYLYYFNDQLGCLLLSLVFFFTTMFSTLATRNFEIPFMGLGFLFGATCGFIFGFFRIKYIEKNLNKHIFCDNVVVKVPRRRLVKSADVVYRRKG